MEGWPYDSIMPLLIRGSDGIARKAHVMTALTVEQRSSGMMYLKGWLRLTFFVFEGFVTHSFVIHH